MRTAKLLAIHAAHAAALKDCQIHTYIILLGIIKYSDSEICYYSLY